MGKQLNKDSQKQKKAKKPYARPEITSEPVFATVATGCGKLTVPNPCNFPPISKS